MTNHFFYYRYRGTDRYQYQYLYRVTFFECRSPGNGTFFSTASNPGRYVVKSSII